MVQKFKKSTVVFSIAPIAAEILFCSAEGLSTALEVTTKKIAAKSGTKFKKCLTDCASRKEKADFYCQLC